MSSPRSSHTRVILFGGVAVAGICLALGGSLGQRRAAPGRGHCTGTGSARGGGRGARGAAARP